MAPHRRGLAEATLWVFEANARARTFYTLHGWLPDGGTASRRSSGAPRSICDAGFPDRGGGFLDRCQRPDPRRRLP
ncbi:MAG: hypothetical protein R3C32_07425 [Chloroflexota bacterium]